MNGINILGGLSANPLATLFDEFVVQNILPIGETGGSEDCLFLDVYVPGSAIRDPSNSKLSVIHWIYGGGYLVGAKDQVKAVGLPFYDGSGLVTQSGNNVIFVASNYRVGAFGFLAGELADRLG